MSGSNASRNRKLTPVRVALAALVAGAALVVLNLAVGGSARNDASPLERATISFASGVLHTLVLTPLAMRLPPHRWLRAIAIFVTLYVTGTLTDLIEAFFFTSLLTPLTLVAALLIGVIPALAVSIIVAALVPTTELVQVAELHSRTVPSWAWRLLVVGLLYVPTYYAFTALVTPIEHPFYSDPTFVAQLQTRTPPDTTIIPLETVRGILFAVALVPSLMVMPTRRWSTLIYLTLIGVVIEAVVPLLGLVTWPLAMRLGNFAELTGDALFRAIVAMLVLGFPPLLSSAGLRERLHFNVQPR